ncbi:hypothetical protein FNU79_08960 [Deinococcus detaillensis]|uniref:Uncharacterized protein n=1 Tax=Deinococcus detaillensis TaxID=2592048 RepID=A0A553V0A9_9DEIO|nr:hypothetical protein [Deinococcus detaillensis]TSA85897.1 hypothetical protein FNU79_08960 [Deinococcus detaillensis]
MSQASSHQPLASALPRPLDFAYPSNRWAAAGLGLGILTAKVLGHSWPGSLRIGLGTFSSWAIARELDPDVSDTALAAMPLAFLALLARPSSTEAHQAEPLSSLRHALPAFTALSSTRTLAATVGVKTSPQDAAALGVQAALSALSSGHVVSLMPSAALTWSSEFEDDFSAPPLSGVAVAAAGALPTSATGAGSSVLSDLLSLAALGLGAQLTAPERISSRCDEVPTLVSSQRVRAARLLSLGTLGLALLRRETLALAPLAAACISVGARRAFKR